jgi:hypothetical protein
MFKVPEEFRVTHGLVGSDSTYGCNGFFVLPNPITRNGKPALRVQASDGASWEHVSVSTEFRCPTWDEMCFVKSMFWDAEDTVIQFHPPRSRYKNLHPFCLHLWRRIGLEIELPDLSLV